MLTVLQFGVLCGLICYAIGYIMGYQACKDLWRCKCADRCQSNNSITGGDAVPSNASLERQEPRT